MLAHAEKTCQGKTSAWNGMQEIAPDVGESGKFGRATTRRRGTIPSVRDNDLYPRPLSPHAAINRIEAEANSTQAMTSPGSYP